MKRPFVNSLVQFVKFGTSKKQLQTPEEEVSSVKQPKQEKSKGPKKPQLLYVFLLVLSVLFSASSFAQGTQVAKPYKSTSACYGYLEYLPVNYNAVPAKKFPVIIFLHGIGEKGAGTEADLAKVANNGIPKLIKAGKWPVKSPITGLVPAEEFIVLSPQNGNGFFNPDLLSKFINYAKTAYANADPDRVYVTGLSAGGISIWNYINKYNDEVAAVVPIAGNGNSVAANAQFFKDIPLWAFHGDADGTVNTGGSINPVNKINACTPTPNPKARVSIYNGVGHDSWSRTYDLTGINKSDLAYDPYNMSIYDWMLQFKKGAATPTPPVVNAGTDQTLTLPTNSTVISGTAQASETITSYAWTKQSGPSATLTNANTAALTVSNMIAGTYVFRLTVTNSASLTSYDDVTVTVVSAANAAPVASAGNDITITLPTASVVLNGSATDSDGTIASYAWTKVSGGAATLTGATTASLTAAALVQGSYTFRLTVTDDKGATSTDDVVVTVNPAVVSGTAPVANAGTDKIVQLPKDNVSLVGSATDADGTIASYQWTKVSGPACTLTDATTVTLKAASMVSGTYTFRITATDNSGLTNSDDVVVQVTNPPTVDAGADKTVTLPTSSVVLAGTASDADGTVDVYSWTKESGPAATLTNKGTATLTASGLTAGTYVFKLSVKDNVGVLSSDVVTVVVQAAGQSQATASARTASAEPTTLSTEETTVEDVAAAPAEDLDLFMTDKTQLENTWVVVYNEGQQKVFDGLWYPELERDIFSQTGMYFYTILKGSQKVSKKVVITNKY